MSLDRYGRRIHYLRISLTDQCNLRCVYCMPESMTFRPAAELMQDAEILRLVGIFSGLGFNKFRLTGGEPTIRSGFLDLVRSMSAMTGVSEIAITTNGILLKHLAQPLVEARVKRVNVSLDTLNPERFKTLTRWGRLEDVLSGIEKAEAAGMRIKINAVVVRGVNDTADAIELARQTMERDWQVRFLELMPLGSISDFQNTHVVTEDELLKTIGTALGQPVLQDNGLLDGEARIYKLPGSRGTLGFISAVSKPFCAGCNRVRLTADGKLRLCLLREREVDLLKPLREGASDTELSTYIERAIWVKPWGHGLAQKVVPMNRVMSEIGG